MRSLLKRDVEQLLADYDADPIAALSAAMRIVLELPDADYRALVAAAPLNAARRLRLLAGDVATLDELARELNETRTLTARHGS